jgi:hypothetical protein
MDVPFARSGVALALTLCALAATALTAPSSLAGPAAASARQATSGLLDGVNIVGLGYDSLPQEADRAIAYARQLNVRVVRTDVPWAIMEPAEPKAIDAHALAFTDRLIIDAAAAGIGVVMTVSGTPCWASSAPPSLLRSCSLRRQGAANTWPPSAPAAYAAFVAYLAGRYGSRLAAIEIWNEPDQANEDYFGGPHKAQRYAAVLRAAYTAIKQADPTVRVLAGSLVGSNGVFLRALYAAGVKGFYDGLSVHFYNLTLGSLRSIHEVQLANGDATPLWLDEFGWTSCWPRRRTEQEQACVTAPIQAANLGVLLRTLAQTPWVAAAEVYKLQNSPAEDFGLLSANGARKPAFTTLARLLPTLSGGLGTVSLRLGRSGSRVLASGTGPVGDFMLLEAFQGAVLRYRAVFTLDRFNRFSIPLPSVLGTHGLRVRVYQYWSGPGRAAQKSI